MGKGERMGLTRFALAAALAAAAVGAVAADKDGCLGDEDVPVLCGYEPTSLGFTKDSDDVRFLDFNLSMRYRLAPHKLHNWLGDDTGLYFAFSGRFGQYIGTRDSAPVVGKRYEPKLFVRHWTGDTALRREYWDFAYGHESNGQSIGNAADLARARAQAQQPEFANDQLSRGWDFLEVTRKWVPDDKARYSAQWRLRLFLDRGLLQSQVEDYNSWEQDREGKRRNRVNGLSGRFGYEVPEPAESEHPGIFSRISGGTSVAVSYETGYREPLRYSTFRFDFGLRVAQLPLNLWFRTGYGSDLAQFYKRVNSKGVEFRIANF